MERAALSFFKGKSLENEVDRAGLPCFSYKNRDFGALSETNEAAPRRSREWSLTYIG